MKRICDNLDMVMGRLDVESIREDFPILRTRIHGKRLIYLDNAATTQKPQQVIDAVNKFYSNDNANIHRGVYTLSQHATLLHEGARVKVQRFINAPESRQVIFTRGTTESINLVASTYGRTQLKAGDEILITWMEHHSNIVPWQMLCEQTGAVLKVAPINDRGELLMDEYRKLLTDRTKIVSVVHVSNSLGSVNPVKEMIRLAHECGAVVMVDGAQWVAHGPTDVQDLDCDFYAFSGHKLLGPTGIGVLYGKAELLEAMPPYQGGGDMISAVTFQKTTYNDLPHKFEAGTPHIAGVIGLAAAVDYIRGVGFGQIVPYEEELLAYGTETLEAIPGLRIIGTAERKAGVLSFVMEDPPISPLDLGTQLDLDGVSVRTGHHCCQPVMDRFGIPGTARASLAFYNTQADIDALVSSLRKIREKTRRTQVQAGPAVQDAIAYPKAIAPTPNAAADELAETFEMLEDRESRNEYMLDLAGKLPHLFNTLKVLGEDYRVKGCMSQVYLVARRAPGSSDALEFVADADAEIVRGLIALLQQLYSGQSAEQILAFDVEGFFRRIQLDQFISSQRRNGLAGMVQRIRASAKTIAAQGQGVS